MTVVLIVDDVRPLAEQYAYDLGRIGGFDVRVADSGREALERLRREVVDCLVLDLEMPGMDGFDVLRQIEHQGLEIPVVVYTGTGDFDRCVQALRLGAYGFLDKSEPMERVVHEVRAALRRRALEDRVDELAAMDLRKLGDRPTRPEAGVVVAGYSFGADVGLSVDRDDVAGWLAIAPTLGLLAADRYRAARSTRPAVIVVGDQDEFCPPDHARRLTADWKATTVIVLAGERHQLATAQAALTDQVAAFLPQVTGGLPG